MRQPLSAALLVALLAPVVACDAPPADGDPDAWEFPEHAGKDDALSGGLVASDAQTVRVFDGFNVVVDASVGDSCVQPRSGPIELAAFRAGGDISEETMRYVETLDELHEALDVSAQAQVKVGPLGGGASLGIAKDFKSTETSLAILLRSRHHYTVINQDSHFLTDEALELAEQDADAFVRKCGTHYVAGVEYGAELRILIQIETRSAQEKEEVRAELEANGIRAGAANIDAGVSTTLSETLTREGVTVTARTEIRGFEPSVSLAAIEGNPLDPSAMALAKQATEELHASVKADKCHDQGEHGPGSCDGRPALGYAANGSRTARPVGVQLQPYRQTADFPNDADAINAFLEQEQAAERAMAFVGAHADLFNVVTRVYNDEVGAMLASNTPYDFTLYRPDKAFVAAAHDHVMAAAETLGELYDPERGGYTKLLATSVADCWDRAQFNDFSDCQGRPDAASSFQTVEDGLDRYDEEMRIRPIYYTVADATSEWDEAVEACPAGSRLPNNFESTRLLAALAINPDVPEPRFRPDEVKGEWALWVSDEFGDCDSESGAYVEFEGSNVKTACYRNPLLASDMELPVFCIPNAGPYGANVPAL